MMNGHLVFVYDLWISLIHIILVLIGMEGCSPVERYHPLLEERKFDYYLLMAHHVLFSRSSQEVEQLYRCHHTQGQGYCY
jgi:hypothetical protein